MKDPYRVVWLLPALSPLNQAFLEAVARHPEIELEVLICSKGLPGRVWKWHERPGSYNATFLSGYRLGQFGFNPKIIAHCIKKRPDLWVITTYDQPTAQLAMAVLTVLGKPWAFCGERPGMKPNSLVRNLLRSLALFMPVHFATCAIGTGTLAADKYRQLFRDDRRTYSIPYLIDLDAFLRYPVPDANGRPIRFFYCGQLIPRKGITILAAAMRRLLEEGAEASLLVLGDGPEREVIEDLNRRFPGRIQLSGFVAYRERATIYAAADVFVFPSRHDGWGAVVHEAMARGMPVISTPNVGAAYDLVQNGVSGFLTSADSVEGTYGAMRYFVDNPHMVREFGERARQVAKRYTPEWGAEVLLGILRDLSEFQNEKYSQLDSAIDNTQSRDR